MRTRTTKSRNYNKKVRKKKAKLKTQPQEFDDEPVPTTQLAAFKLNVANPTNWYELNTSRIYAILYGVMSMIRVETYYQKYK